MWPNATLRISRAALWVASIGGLGLLIALCCGEGETVAFRGALIALIAVRCTAELGHGYLWHRLQPPGRRARARFVAPAVSADSIT